MPGLSAIQWFKNISISKKLYFAVGIMALLIAAELMILWFAVTTLSSVRAFVGGEGLWSKSQKDAVYSLREYARTHEEKDYLKFREFMKVPLGDHKTRLELIKPNPDMDMARQGFIEGRNHPEDVDGMIKLFTRFHRVPYIKRAIEIWTEADVLIAPLLPIGEEIRKEINSETPSQEDINKLLELLNIMNTELTVVEDEFSYTLGEGSRWLEDLILKLLFAVALTVEITGLLLTISVSRDIQKGIGEITTASKAVATGDLKARARVFSGDEIGMLAASFNKMAEELSKSEQQIETIFRSAPDAVIVINSEGKIVRWNPKAETLFGWRAAEVIGNYLHETIIPPRYREAHRNGLAHYLKTGEGPVLNTTMDMSALKRDNTEFDVELSISASGNRRNPLFIGFIRDVTQRKNSEVALKEYAKKLEQSNSNLEQFAYVASHDLQEPLRTITNFAGLLEDNRKDYSDPASRKYMGYVVHAANRMKSLIKDLLMFSRIGKERPIELVRFNEVVNDVIIDLATAIEESQANIHVDELPVMAANKTEIKLLFQNLLNNAIKYRQKDTIPSIRIKALRQENGEWLFSISDNGIGIESSYAEKIFVIFQRLHNENEYSGTGIGLATCKKIIDLNGGNIWVESKPGLGSIFYFTLPNT